MATIIKTDGTRIEIIKPTLADLQNIVGGYIEALNLGNKTYLVVNEEGRLEGLALNTAATKIYRRDMIVGNAVLCTFDELN